MEDITEPRDGAYRSALVRWRAVPVAVIGTVGTFLASTGILLLIASAYITWRGQPSTVFDSYDYASKGLPLGLWGLACGIALVIAAWELWKLRWRRTLALLGACFVAAWILSLTGLMPE